MIRITVLLCDDHAIVRTGLRLILEQGEECAVVGEAETAERALALAGELQPDVVILDLSMPGQGGLSVLPQFAAIAPRTRVLVLTVHDEPAYLVRALDAGVHGYLLKGATAEALRAALRLMVAGGMPIDQALQASLRSHADGHPASAPAEESRLTAREAQVLRRISAGYTNREIAASLGISLRTVERQRSALGSKLGLQRRAELVSYALKSQQDFGPDL